MEGTPAQGEARPGLLDRIAGGAVLGVARAVGALPPAAGDALGAGLGTATYLLDAAHRRRAVDNLLRAGVAEDGAAARRLARRVFQNLGRSFADTCRLLRLPDATLLERVPVEGYEHFVGARGQGRGVVLVTAHLGAWELLPALAAARGHPIHVVVRPMDNVTLDRALTALRTRGGNGVIRKQDLMREGLRLLKAGETVGILMDQNIASREGVFVAFFGRSACTAAAPALLALRTGATVLPVAIFRAGPGRHRIVVEKPIGLARTGDLRADVQENTARFTRAIEDLIRRSPAEWFWVHRRWKTQPAPAGEPPRGGEPGERGEPPPAGAPEKKEGGRR